MNVDYHFPIRPTYMCNIKKLKKSYLLRKKMIATLIRRSSAEQIAHIDAH